MLIGQTHRLAVTTRQNLGFSVLTVPIDGANCMDYVFCRQMPTARNDRLPGGESSNRAYDLAALSENRRPSGAMNRPIYPTAAEQR